MTDKSISDALREVRESRGVSQGELAKRMRSSQSHVSRWETTQEPGIDRIAGVEDALDVPRGTTLRMVGYIDDQGADIVDLLRLDPNLTDDQREMLVEAYEAAKRRNNADSAKRRRRRSQGK